MQWKHKPKSTALLFSDNLIVCVVGGGGGSKAVSSLLQGQHPCAIGEQMADIFDHRLDEHRERLWLQENTTKPLTYRTF